MKEVKIDATYLQQLAGEDRAFVVGIIDEFVNQTHKTLDELEQNLSPQLQPDSVAQSLHQLKGASASLGMVSFSHIISNMEQWDPPQWKSRPYDHDQLLKHLESSVQLCKRVLA